MSGTKVDRNNPYTAQTGKINYFEIEPRVMTISFILDQASQVDSSYPKYLLESTDGAYSTELSPRSDLVKQGQYFQLRFEELRTNRLYTLTRKTDDTTKDIVFQEVPYETIVDQKRDTHEPLKEHAYALDGVELGDSVTVEPWDLGG